MELAYYNGKISAYGDCAIPLSDRSIYFGEGVYDAYIGRNGAIYLEYEHTERFYSNLARLGIDIGMKKSELSALFRYLIGLYGGDCFFLYVQAGQTAERRLHTAPCGKGSLLITVTDVSLPRPDERIALTVAEDKRHGMCDVKTLNLLQNVLAARKAQAEGFDEAVLVKNGRVTECTRSNVAIIEGNTLYTHPANGEILRGVMRTQLLKTARELGLSTVEEPFSPERMIGADAVLVTSSTKLCRAVDRIGNVYKNVEDGSHGDVICRKLYADFIKMTE